MPPYVIRLSGAEPFGTRFALVDAEGRLLREPDLTAVGRFAADELIAAYDLDGAGGYLDHSGQWRIEPTLTDVRRFSASGLARFADGDRWGYADAQGAVVVEARFAEAEPFGLGLAAVREEQGFHYIDVSGQVRIPGPFAVADVFSPVGLAAVARDGERLAGFIDADGTMVVEPRFVDALPFSPQGAAPVRDGELWGLIDTAGGWIVEPTYARIDEFNGDGLAFFERVDHWNEGTGYLDSTGAEVITGGRRLSSRMECGLARTDLSDLGFVDRTGALAVPGPFDWADHFDACGATVARREGVWGVLRADGAFTAAPYLEPLTEDGWVIGFGGGQGVAPFLTEYGSVVYVDPQLRVVSRVEVVPDLSPEAEEGALLLQLFAGEGAEPVWQSEPDFEAFARPTAFLAQGPEHHFDEYEAWEGEVVELAEALLDEEPLDFAPFSLVGEGWRDVYDLSEMDDDEAGDRALTGAMLVLASVYVSEEHWSAYPFLDAERGAAFGEYFDVLAERLAERFGAAEKGEDPLLRGDGNLSLWWQVDGRRLVLEGFSNYGDGDFEHQLWLAVIPGGTPAP